jgi:hypothetical protein
VSTRTGLLALEQAWVPRQVPSGNLLASSRSPSRRTLSSGPGMGEGGRGQRQEAQAVLGRFEDWGRPALGGSRRSRDRWRRREGGEQGAQRGSFVSTSAVPALLALRAGDRPARQSPQPRRPPSSVAPPASQPRRWRLSWPPRSPGGGGRLALKEPVSFGRPPAALGRGRV